MKLSSAALLIGWIVLTLAPPPPAQAAATVVPSGPAAAAANAGIIEGRVLNPASGEYLGNAEVRLQGTELRAVTQSDGRYRLVNVPPGNATVVVTYTGYESATTAVTVGGGEVVVRNFDLKSSLPTDTGRNVVALDRFTVAAAREGTAKAIMEQRSAMTVKNVVATDTFGAIVEGNVGDVLQYVAGMQVIYSGDVPSTVSMGGMDSKYGALMVDGVRTSGATRAPALSSYSAYATDTIEINKTNSAEMDADAPAGSINMRSKSAFQRKGRFFSWEVYSIYNTHNPFTLGKVNGPNDGKSRPLNPSLVLDYSDVFLNGKLGVVMNLAETNSTSGSGFLNFTYNPLPTAPAPLPTVITGLQWGKGAIIQKRRGGGLNLEYKLTPQLTLALRGQASWEDARNYNKNFAITATRATLGAGSNDLVFIGVPTANNVNRFNLAGGLSHRIRNTHSFSPQLFYEGKRLTLDVSLAYSRLGEYRSNLRAQGPMDDEVGSANMQLFGVGWTARRSGIGETAFDFQQTAGPDLYVLNNWRATSLTNNIVRAPNEPTTKNLLAQINAKYAMDWTYPTFFKAGLKSTAASFYSLTGSYSWTYVGPTGDRLQADQPVTVAPFDPFTGGNIFDRQIPFPDRHAIGVIQRQHPEYFIPNPTNLTAAGNLQPERSAREYIDAGYFLANTRFGRLMVQGGVRYEKTENEGKSYERNVLRKRQGDYADTFFSGAVRYRFTDKLMAIASFSQSIQRANLNSLSGVLSVNDTTRTGTLPNPELKPEHGNNYSIRVEQYFEPAGTFSIGVFQFDITDLHRSVTGIPAESIGLDDDYPGYTFTALSNVGDFTNKGIEFAYSQQLVFLPGVFRGLGVFANYNQFTRSNPELAYRAAPKTASAGVSFRYRRLNVAIRGAWSSESLENATGYLPAYLFLGTSLNFRLTERTSLTVTGRNITNQARYVYLRNQRGVLNQFEIQGASWVFGVKGVF
jgi:iron complex outermembrane receptor protein